MFRRAARFRTDQKRAGTEGLCRNAEVEAWGSRHKFRGKEWPIIVPRLGAVPGACRGPWRSTCKIASNIPAVLADCGTSRFHMQEGLICCCCCCAWYRCVPKQRAYPAPTRCQQMQAKILILHIACSLIRRNDHMYLAILSHLFFFCHHEIHARVATQKIVYQHPFRTLSGVAPLVHHKLGLQTRHTK